MHSSLLLGFSASSLFTAHEFKKKIKRNNPALLEDYLPRKMP
jgi:hypothetical protein